MLNVKDLKVLVQAIEKSNNHDIKLLYDEFGAETIAKIIHMFGGGSIYIPLEETILKDYTAQQIVNDYKHGDNFKTISQRYNMSERTVRRTIDRWKSEDNK